MITVGDVQFESPRSKIFTLTNSIFAMTSGEASVNAEIMAGVHAAVQKRLADDATWMPVEEAVRMVSSQVQRYNMRTGDLQILSPLGLSRDAFLKFDRSHWFQGIFDKLFAVDCGSDIIVAGVDEQGAHIWKIDGRGNASCHDPAAFAAIGSGQRHAESQFQQGYHAIFVPFPQTLFLTYKAKKRSEVAPGVGRLTDMGAVGGLGRWTRFALDDIDFLDGLYVALLKAEYLVAQKHDEELTAKFQEMAAAAQRQTASEQGDPEVNPVGPDET